MSEGQWARLLSSLNVGSGVPCTITTVNGEEVPDPPAPTPATDTFKAEMSDTLVDAVRLLEGVRERVSQGR